MTKLSPDHAPQLIEPGTAFAHLAGLDGHGSDLADRIDGARSQGVAVRAERERFDVVVIGGGQAGLSMGYHLKQQGARFVILDAHARVGDAWRKRWDSLRLFTPAWLSSLDGFPMPGSRGAYPTKDQMADYLEAYAARFALPIHSSTRVERLTRRDGRFLLQCGARELEADRVVIAMASFQQQRMPAFARELRSDIVQLASSDYKNPGQLREGSVLIAGCGNSGAEIAMELSRSRPTTLIGTPSGEVPFRMQGFWGRLILARLLMRVIFHRVLTIRTPLGRKARPKMMFHATPLIRTQSKDLARAGVTHLRQRIIGVRDGLPLLDTGETLDVSNVIWCTGYNAAHSFIDLPIFDENGHPKHEAGVVTDQPGLYFVGLPFLYSMSSAMIHGVGRDCARLAKLITLPVHS
jgi:putative flavoprotein involved in K+ transport